MSDAAVAGLSRRTEAPYARNRSKRHPALEAELIEGADVYDALRDDWRRIADSRPGALLFQTPELLSIWARHFPKQRLATIVVRDAGRAVMFWPLSVERQAVFTIARGAGVPIGQYDDILLAPDVDGTAALEAALDALRSSLRPDVVLLERVRADSALRAALHQASPISSEEAAPYADLSGGLHKFMDSRTTRVARQQRKRVRRFEQEGRVAFQVATAPEVSEAWLAEALALKREWLRSTGRLSRAFMKRETTDCLIALARCLTTAEQSPRAIVSRLSLDGRTAAIEMGFADRGVYRLYLGAFAPDFARYGPGNVLTEKLLHWCSANGIHCYDMLAPRSRNKREWQSGEVAVLDFALPMSAGGKLYLEAGIKRIGPALRDAFYGLPMSLRSALVGLALRA